MIEPLTEINEIVNFIAEHGCMYHRDEIEHCDRGNSEAYWRIDGDVWCQSALDSFQIDCRLPRGAVEYIGSVALDPTPTDEPADELYGCTGEAAQWIRDNVGLN